MRVALDTNVLVYAQGVDDAARQLIAENLAQKLPLDRTFIPAQVIGELYNTLVRRGRTRDVARQAAEYWRATFSLVETTGELLTMAIDLATQSRLKIWDGVVLAAAAQAQCDLLLSEDFQEGFAWRGVTVVNPFAEKPHRLLERLMRDRTP